MKNIRVIGFWLVWVLLITSCKPPQGPGLSKDGEIDSPGELDELSEFSIDTASLLAEAPTNTPFQPGGITARIPDPVLPTLTQIPQQKDAIGGTFPNSVPSDSKGDRKSTISILLIGSDKRSGGSTRTDTLIFVAIRPLDGSVSLVSIPRDLWVSIPGWKNYKINTAYMHGQTVRKNDGGETLLKETLLHNFGVQVNHIVMVDFSGFRKVIDAVGGLDIPLACPYTDWHIVDPNRSIQDPNNWKLFKVGPGLVHMDGDLALWYARSRLKSSDFDRERRQQEVIRAAYTRALQLDVLSKLPELYGRTRDSFTTDLTLKDLIALAPLATHINSAHIRSYYIQNKMLKATTVDRLYVLLPDKERIRTLFALALAPSNERQYVNQETVVEIWNGSPNPRWELLAAERMHYGGFQTMISRADDTGYKKTILLDFTGGKNQGQISKLLSVLGLPISRLKPMEDLTASVPYRLVIGKDYNPCFNPSKLAR